MLGLGESEKELARDFGSGLNDVIGRGTLASLIGLPGDLGGLAENGIRSALGMPQVQPYGGSEHIGQKLEEAGLVSPVRRPKTELLASLISPSQAASAAYRAPQMARAGVRMLDNLADSRGMGRGLANSQVGAIENLWHGSPHTFDRFDLSKIGTGEGAQAYGHGAYLAESPEVAKNYQMMLAGSSGRTGGRVTIAGAPDGMMRVYGEGADGQSVLIGDFPPDKAMKALNDYNMSRGNLYQTRLAWPDPAREAADPLSPDHFLHWDKPLSEQGEAVQGALKRAFGGKYDSMGDMTGGNLYTRTDAGLDPHWNAMNPASAAKSDSEWLNRMGIPGIRYLDGGSRGAGAGSHNYVVFDDRLIDIVSRNGQPVGNLGKMVAPQDEALRVAQQNAAKPIEEGGLGLRPDNTPEERAAAMGFDTPAYHGTSANVPEFDIGKAGTQMTKDWGDAAYLTPSPSNAEYYAIEAGSKAAKADAFAEYERVSKQYGNNAPETFAALNEYRKVARIAEETPQGANIMPLLLDTSRAEDYVVGSGMTDPYLYKTLRMAENNKDVARILDNPSRVSEYAVFNPSRIRSRFAAFDPMRRDSSDILAGLAPLGLGAWMYQDE